MRLWLACLNKSIFNILMVNKADTIVKQLQIIIEDRDWISVYAARDRHHKLRLHNPIFLSNQRYFHESDSDIYHNNYNIVNRGYCRSCGKSMVTNNIFVHKQVQNRIAKAI